MFYFVVISDITCKLKETPTECELHYLLFDIRDKWYVIGLSLQVHRNILDDLKKTLNDHVKNLDEVINNFLTSQPSFVKWETVITAIEGPIVNDKERADEIRQYVSTGKSNKLSLLNNEVINSGVQTTPAKYIQFSLNQHCSDTAYIS